MKFSSTYQPRYVVVHFDESTQEHVIVKRTTSLFTAIVARDSIVETGGAAYFRSQGEQSCESHIPFTASAHSMARVMIRPRVHVAVRVWCAITVMLVTSVATVSVIGTLAMYS